MARLGVGRLPGPAGVCGTRTAFSVQPRGAVVFVRACKRAPVILPRPTQRVSNREMGLWLLDGVWELLVFGALSALPWSGFSRGHCVLVAMLTFSAWHRLPRQSFGCRCRIPCTASSPALAGEVRVQLPSLGVRDGWAAGRGLSPRSPAQLR